MTSQQEPGAGDPRAITVAAYAALFLFGLAQGMLGTFFYAAGPAPAAALGFDVAILATCMLGGWGMRGALGALAPAAGWFIVTFYLASGTSGGSVLITATTAGEWYLFGGALSATAGLAAGAVGWSRPRRARGRP